MGRRYKKQQYFRGERGFLLLTKIFWSIRLLLSSQFHTLFPWLSIVLFELHYHGPPVEGDGRRGRRTRRRRPRPAAAAPQSCRVALVLLAEAHLALSSSLGHADVVHHEQVDVDVVGAGAADLLVV